MTQCLLVKNSEVTFVYGKADIFVTNTDFTKLTLNPDLAIKIAESYQKDKNGFLIGQLGVEQNGVFAKYTLPIDIENSAQEKEICLYEFVE